MIYLESKYFSEALGNFSKAIDIFKNLYDEKNISVAQNLYLIGKCYYEQDDYELAYENFQKSYDITRENLGDKHPDSLKIKELLKKTNKKFQN